MAQNDEAITKPVFNIIREAVAEADNIPDPDRFDVTNVKDVKTHWEFKVERIAQYMLAEPYSMNVTGPRASVALQNGRRIGHRATIIGAGPTLNALGIYRNNIVSNIRGFILPLTVRKRHVGDPNALDMEPFRKRFNVFYDNRTIHVEAMERFRVKTLTDYAYMYQVGADGRAYIMSLYLHSLAYIDAILSNALPADTNLPEQPAVDILHSTYPVLDNGVPTLTSPEQQDVSQWMRASINPRLHSMIFEICKLLVSRKIRSDPDNSVSAQPGRRTDRSVLKLHQLVNLRYARTHTIMQHGAHTNNFLARICSFFMYTLIKGGKLTEEAVYTSEWPEGVENNLERCLRGFLMCVRESAFINDVAARAKFDKELTVTVRGAVTFYKENRANFSLNNVHACWHLPRANVKVSMASAAEWGILTRLRASDLLSPNPIPENAAYRDLQPDTAVALLQPRRTRSTTAATASASQNVPPPETSRPPATIPNSTTPQSEQRQPDTREGCCPTCGQHLTPEALAFMRQNPITPYTAERLRPPEVSRNPPTRTRPNKRRRTTPNSEATNNDQTNNDGDMDNPISMVQEEEEREDDISNDIVPAVPPPPLSQPLTDNSASIHISKTASAVIDPVTTTRNITDISRTLPLTQAVEEPAPSSPAQSFNVDVAAASNAVVQRTGLALRSEPVVTFPRPLLVPDAGVTFQTQLEAAVANERIEDTKARYIRHFRENFDVPMVLATRVVERASYFHHDVMPETQRHQEFPATNPTTPMGMVLDSKFLQTALYTLAGGVPFGPRRRLDVLQWFENLGSLINMNDFNTYSCFKTWRDMRQYMQYLSLYAIFNDITDTGVSEDTWRPMRRMSAETPEHQRMNIVGDRMGVDNPDGFPKSLTDAVRTMHLSCISDKINPKLTWHRDSLVVLCAYSRLNNGRPARPHRTFYLLVTDVSRNDDAQGVNKSYYMTSAIVLGASTPFNNDYEFYRGHTGVMRSVGYIRTYIESSRAAVFEPGLNQHTRQIGCTSLGMAVDYYKDMFACRRCVRDSTALGAVLASLNCTVRDDGQSLLSRAVTGIGHFSSLRMSRYICSLLQNTGSQAIQEEFGSVNSSQAAVLTEGMFTVANRASVNPFSKTLVVVGPAGTGKTNTLIHHMAMLLNHKDMFDCVLKSEAARAVYATAQTESTTTSERTINELRAPRSNMMYLVLCPTNAAVDVIEERLQEGLCIFHEDGTNFTRVYPLSTRYVNEESTSDLRTANDEKRMTLFPHMPANTRGGYIHICTFGSMCRAFLELETEGSSTGAHMHYTAIFIDEASQVSTMEMYTLLYYIRHQQMQAGAAHVPAPFLYVYGDPMQQSPFLRGSPNTLLRAHSVSWLDRMVPSASTSVQGENIVNVVQLQVQYRMQHNINVLSNILVDREVQTAGVVRNRDPPIAYRSTRPRIVRKHQTKITLEDLAFPIVFFDPYDDLPRNTRISHFDRNEREGRFVERIVANLKRIQGFDVNENVAILTHYNNQAREINSYLRRSVPLRSVTRLNAKTIRRAQGTGIPIVIYSAGRVGFNPENGRYDMNPGILQELQSLYVMVSRAQSHLFIVGHSGYLSSINRHWRDLVDYCDTYQVVQ